MSETTIFLRIACWKCLVAKHIFHLTTRPTIGWWIVAALGGFEVGGNNFERQKKKIWKNQMNENEEISKKRQQTQLEEDENELIDRIELPRKRLKKIGTNNPNHSINISMHNFHNENNEIEIVKTKEENDLVDPSQCFIPNWFRSDLSLNKMMAMNLLSSTSDKYFYINNKNLSQSQFNLRMYNILLNKETTSNN